MRLVIARRIVPPSLLHPTARSLQRSAEFRATPMPSKRSRWFSNWRQNVPEGIEGLRIHDTAIMNAPRFEPAAEKYVSLATYRRNGVEVATPVWIAELAGRYYVFSAGDAGKIKRIRA